MLPSAEYAETRLALRRGIGNEGASYNCTFFLDRITFFMINFFKCSLFKYHFFKYGWDSANLKITFKDYELTFTD